MAPRLATNALITRRLPRTAVVTTQGFRDVHRDPARQQGRPLGHLQGRGQALTCRGRDRLTVPERIDAAGKVIEPLDVDAAREVARILKRRGVAAIAVCFMNATSMAENERANARDPAEGNARHSGLDLLAGASRNLRARAVLDHGRQRRREPGGRQLHHRLGDRLAHEGYTRDLLLLAHRRRRHDAGERQGFRPPRLAAPELPRAPSPAATSQGLCGFSQFDRPRHGRTSTDVSLAYEGQSRITKDWYIEFGYPIRFCLDRGADHRRRRRIARLDRSGGSLR